MNEIVKKKQIVVIAEHRQGNITPVTGETLSLARELGRILDLETTIIIPGISMENQASHTAGTTGMNVIGIKGEGLELYNCEAYLEALTGLLKTADLHYIILPHTAMGYDLAPRLAVRLKASCITAVEQLSGKGESVTFLRSQWNGKIILEVALLTERKVVTVLPGSWPALDEKPEKPGQVTIIPFESFTKHSKTTGIKEAGRTEFDLTKADVIVAAGRGLRKEENLPVIYELSGIFPKSAVGASRAACDAGWFDYGRQIGITGKTVSPKLYIACGISGSTQHIAGMKGSQMVVAINTDPAASIFGIADYCIVEDLTTFIPCLLEEYGIFSRRQDSE
ncbi:MAG: electron transfer flavoprotein subunit alpha/FixB family protein [Deltaproteobacteria bacterium]|nr:electron transfer flavoprotein subunit alpha/FixB family protein [Deltaproteobacteria bacterium]